MKEGAESTTHVGEEKEQADGGDNDAGGVEETVDEKAGDDEVGEGEGEGDNDAAEDITTAMVTVMQGIARVIIFTEGFSWRALGKSLAWVVKEWGVKESVAEAGGSRRAIANCVHKAQRSSESLIAPRVAAEMHSIHSNKR